MKKSSSNDFKNMLKQSIISIDQKDKNTEDNDHQLNEMILNEDMFQFKEKVPQKNESHSYFSLTINEQKQYVRSIYYRIVPWNQLVSKWFIKNELIFISANNPLFIKIAENKVTLLNDKYRLIHKNTFNKDNESNTKNKQIKKLINWNKALQEENLKLKTQLKDRNHG